MSDSESRDCRAAALRLLGRREHSCKELQQKLFARGFETPLVGEVVTQLQANDLLSDDRFAENYVRAKMGRGTGPVRLRHALREHGVADELIDRYLHQQDWPQLAIEVRQKRFGSGLPQSYEERAKQMRFLQYRGFSAEQINGAMKQNEY